MLRTYTLPFMVLTTRSTPGSSSEPFRGGSSNHKDWLDKSTNGDTKLGGGSLLQRGGGVPVPPGKARGEVAVAAEVIGQHHPVGVLPDVHLVGRPGPRPGGGGEVAA